MAGYLFVVSPSLYTKYKTNQRLELATFIIIIIMSFLSKPHTHTLSFSFSFSTPFFSSSAVPFLKNLGFIFQDCYLSNPGGNLLNFTLSSLDSTDFAFRVSRIWACNLLYTCFMSIWVSRNCMISYGSLLNWRILSLFWSKRFVRLIKFVAFCLFW